MNNAIFDYLVSQGDKFANSAEIFKKEASIVEIVDAGKGLLEKKWTSVIRLQKRVMELEGKVESMQKLGTHAPSGSESNLTASSVASGPSKALPKPPAKATLTGHRQPVTTVACHPVYSLFASGAEDSTIRIWDHETSQCEKSLKGHTGAVTGVAFDSRGQLLASCSVDMSAKIWDTNTWTCTKTLKGHDHTLSGIKFLPSSDQLLTCSRDCTVKCWEVATGYCTRTFSGHHSDWVKCISVSLDGQFLSSAGNDQTIVIWQLATGQAVQVS